MTNEAKLIIETGLPIPFTISNTTGIEKGTLLKLTDLMTAAQADGDADLVAGISASEKIASDGKVKLGVYREGFFKVIASGTINIGDPLAMDGDGLNYVYHYISAANLSGIRIIGTAHEAATDEETFIMELKPQQVLTST